LNTCQKICLYYNILILQLWILASFCGLFYNADSTYNTDWYVELWVMDWKGFGRKMSWHFEGITREIVWKDWGKPWETLARITVCWSRFEHSTSEMHLIKCQVIMTWRWK
jgi:hypothetical protein